MIRKESGQWVKENPEITTKKENLIVALKVMELRAERLASLEGNDGWLCAQEMLDEKLERIDYKLDNFDAQDQRANDLLLQEKKSLRFLRNIVDDMKNSLSGIQSAIERNEKELSERESNTVSR